jgi:hypothetical protein
LYSIGAIDTMDYGLWRRIDQLLAQRVKLPQTVLEVILTSLPNYNDQNPQVEIEVDARTEKYLRLLMTAYARESINHDG